ncbi:c-type cytochrome [Deinococcus fonticola]|uniref:c-type cytochrome n=1 Tax=Deinococcus fonticola TaxID=2528713 RepID=UPI0010757510|nr:cytochrome c [Deinococcus fonticola]
MKKWILAATALSFLTFASAAPSAAAGKKVFDANCAACHGDKAQGAIGPSLKDASKWKYDLFKRALKQGKDDKGVPLKAMMPKFPKLSDADMKSLQLHLKAVTK